MTFVPRTPLVGRIRLGACSSVAAGGLAGGLEAGLLGQALREVFLRYGSGLADSPLA